MQQVGCLKMQIEQNRRALLDSLAILQILLLGGLGIYLPFLHLQRCFISQIHYELDHFYMFERRFESTLLSGDRVVFSPICCRD